jgi:hypothetical protein
MHNRLRLLMGTTALLYFGPLLAGLGGFGWRVVPVFVAIFMLWLFILRPHLWPRHLKDWGRTEALVALAAQGVMQILLVTLCFAIGRGLGGVLGALPPFPLLLPISVSFLSIPLSRLIWDPWQAVGLEGTPDKSLQPGGAAPADQAQAASANALARRLIEPLADLPADIDLATLQSHLAALSGHANEARIRAALMDRAQAGLAMIAELKALVLHTTDARLIKGITENGPAEVLAVLPQDPELIALFADRLQVALQADAGLRPQLPKPGQLSLLADGLRETQAEASLRRLIQTIRDTSPV